MTSKLFFAGAFGCVLVVLLLRLLFKANRQSRNPLDWTALDRSLLLSAVFFVIGSALCFTLGVTWLKAGRLPYVNWEFFPTLQSTWRSVGLVWFFIVIIGLWLHRRGRESKLFTHFVVQFSAFHTALFCYLWGTFSEITAWLFSIALASFIVILFRTAVALPWIPTFIFTVAAFEVGVWLDLLPYGPFFAKLPFVEGKPHIFYAIITLCWAALIFTIMLLAISYVVVRWRDRETRLKDMTGLLKKTFGRYLSEEVMHAIIERPDSIQLGGEKRTVTMMMTDLRGFTQLSERLDPEKVMALLNRYFDVMMKICKKYEGTINDIFGDALLVTFGAPQENAYHAQAAVACAIEMQNAMQAVNEENMVRGLPKLEMGIGLNTAEVVVGNIGTEDRAKFGVVGSGVNVASRIESYAVGGQILVSESVRRETDEILRIDAQRDVFPKGSGSPLRIYEVGGIAGRFNLALEGKAPVLISPPWHIPLRYKLLEGKDVGTKESEGFIVRLSQECAEIILDGSVELLANVKMNLKDVDEKLSTRDFYGKTIRLSEENTQIYLVRFTSVPPEVDGYLQAIRQYGVKSE